MNRNTAFTPLAETFSLLATPPALVTLVVLVVLHAAQMGWMQVTVASVNASGSSATAASIGAVSLLAGLVFAVVRAVLHYRLSRQLGSNGEAELAPNMGFFIGLSILYALVLRFWNGWAPLLFFSQVEDPKSAMTVYMIGLPLSFIVLGTLLFPLLVRLTATAHSGNDIRFGSVWNELWTRKFGWLAGYVLLALAGLALGWLANLFPRSGTTEAALISGLFIGSITGLNQTVQLVYAIATYRAFARERGAGAGVAETFF